MEDLLSDIRDNNFEVDLFTPPFYLTIRLGSYDDCVECNEEYGPVQNIDDLPKNMTDILASPKFKNYIQSFSDEHFLHFDFCFKDRIYDDIRYFRSIQVSTLKLLLKYEEK